MSVMARPFVAAHLHQAVSIMSRLADGLDNELARKLRGRTTFEEAPDRTPFVSGQMVGQCDKGQRL